MVVVLVIEQHLSQVIRPLMIKKWIVEYPGDVVKYQVRGQWRRWCFFHNSDVKPGDDLVQVGVQYQISIFTLVLCQLGSQELESSEKQLTLTNGSGNTTISIEQPDNSNPPPDLEIKVGNSTGNYNLISSYTESPGFSDRGGQHTL